MTATDPIVIVGAARTPMGGFQGELADVKAPELGATAIRAGVGHWMDPALHPSGRDHSMLTGRPASPGFFQ